MRKQVLYLGNYKKNLRRSYYNIVILLLILLTLFSIVGLISKKEASRNTEVYEAQDQELKIERKIENSLFIKTVQHIFPNRSVGKQYKSKFSLEGAYTSFFEKVFKVDFKNPLTFVQVQFPVTASQQEALIANIPKDNNDEEIEEDWTREIHFVDYDGEEKTVTVDTDIDAEYYIDENELTDLDDLGEIEDGIYVIGEEDLVDSLNPVSNQDLSNIPRPKGITVEKGKPSVLIYHTHATESYNPAKEGNFHSLKKDYTVIAVADVITEELEKRGYTVIHDETYHDYPSYNGSYGRSLVTARNILEKNPSIKMVLDIHRDGFDNIDTRSDRLSLVENSRVQINGEYAARFMFVVGGKTENRKEVETFANFAKSISDSKYPGLAKEVFTNQYGKYNQYLSDYAALVEIGSNTNTIEEAKKTGYYLADVLADTLKLLEE